MEKWERVGKGIPQESTAGKDSIRKIDMTFVLGCAKRSIHSPGSSLSKIVDEEAGENFLENEFRLFSMEMDQAYRVFQAAEGGFNAPAHSVELFQSVGRELLLVQVGDEGFCFAMIGRYTDDAEG